MYFEEKKFFENGVFYLEFQLRVDLINCKKVLGIE